MIGCRVIRRLRHTDAEVENQLRVNVDSGGRMVDIGALSEAYAGAASHRTRLYVGELGCSD